MTPTRARSLHLIVAALVLLALLAGCTAVPAAPAPAATTAPEEAPAEPAGAADSATLAPTEGGFPSKPIQLMAPANPGGGWDQTSRLIAQVLQTEGISPVAMEVFNVPGAGGTVGLAQLASQNSGDAHVPMMMGRVMVGAILTNQSPVTLDDTTPIARLTAEYEAIVVPADSPFQTLSDLIEAFQADPRSISWGGGSAGGTDHILVGQIAKEVGVAPEGINYVAYSGGGEAAAAILGGQVSAGVSGVGEWAEFVRSGEMRVLAVSSGERLESLPDAPTLIESGVDVELLNWRGVVAPPGISDEERAWLIELLTRMNESEAWQQALETNSWADVFLAGDEFDQYIEEENATITEVLTEIGLIQ